VTIKHNLVKGSANSLLLTLLDEKPMYGYQIVKELEKRSQGYFRFKEGTLYPALYRLEKAGLVTGSWQLLANGRQRRYYYITDKGRAKLEVEISQWLDFLQAMIPFIQPSGA
jgi:DNA-binding PadR family transcriptional regulator